MSTAKDWRRTVSTAAYIEGSWIITGEQRKYSPPSGGYLRAGAGAIRSRHGTMRGGYGAFELAARYSTINLNDPFHPGRRAPRPGGNGVGGGQQNGLRRGAQLVSERQYPVSCSISCNGNINKTLSRPRRGAALLITPLGTSVGGNFDALVMAYSGRVLSSASNLPFFYEADADERVYCSECKGRSAVDLYSERQS